MTLPTNSKIWLSSWPEALPISSEAIRLAIRALRKGPDHLVVEKSPGIGLMVREMKRRHQILKIEFDPTDKVIKAASYAVAPSFHGSVRHDFLRFFFLGFPKDGSWLAEEAIEFIEEFAGLEAAPPPHKWLAE